MMDEKFREYYERTTGHPWPGVPGELLHVIMLRVMNAVADWCDENKPNKEDKP